jgi:Zn-dependent peptidase ImmA (M78 family)/transcriptional regulator with XRE-family HTH domain
MPADQEDLRKRVRELILRAGTTQARFADEIGLDSTKLSKAVNGVRRFSALELALIAEHHGTTVDWLLTGVSRQSAALAARATSTQCDAWTTALERTKQLADVANALAALDLLDRQPVTDLPRIRYTGKAIVDGPRHADELLRVLDEHEAGDEFRRDPASAIESTWGIAVVVEPLGPEVDGLSFRNAVFSLILVNANKPWSRQRFTIAHELAHHAAQDGGDGLVTDEDVMHTAKRVEEMRANSMAAALLMPEGDLRAQTRDGIDRARFADLLGRYRVSPDALAWRLVGLGIISASERRNYATTAMADAAEAAGWIAEFSELVANERRSRMPMRLFEQALSAFATGEIGARLPAAVLNCEPDVLHDALDAVTAASVEDQPFAAPDDAEPVFIP